MNDRVAAALAGLSMAALALAVLALSACSDQDSNAGDPRQQPPLVRLVEVGPATAAGRGFTGVIGAKVESNLGFRVGGKVIERLVDASQVVKADQPLMRMDPDDLRLALDAKRNAVAAARALAVQLAADEQRFARLASTGAIPRQRYEQV
jgi:multidrug efflux pump subunit AcrA (membrane-fusion protein)